MAAQRRDLDLGQGANGARDGISAATDLEAASEVHEMNGPDRSKSVVLVAVALANGATACRHR